jgi:hypothetical protein
MHAGRSFLGCSLVFATCTFSFVLEWKAGPVRVLVVVAVSVVVGRMRRCKKYGPLIPVP